MRDAKVLRDKVNYLIGCAKQSNGIDFGAVNWGDLRVVDVIKEESLLDGRSEVFVLVEEASPNCHLATWLTEKLNAKGVTVRTEW